MEVVLESSKRLVLLYEKFYYEEPDFSREDVQRKAMAMTHLLWEYGIYLPSSTSFQLSNKNLTKVWSFAVEQLFSSYEAYMENRNDFEVEGSSWSISFAELIGKVVFSYLAEKKLALEFIENVSTILFLRNHSLESMTMVDFLRSQYVDCPFLDIQTILKLLQYLDGLRDYVCATGNQNKYFGVVQNIREQEDTIIQNVELLLSKKKDE